MLYVQKSIYLEIEFSLWRFTASTSKQSDQGSANASPTAASLGTRSTTPSCPPDDVDKPVREEFRIEKRQRLLWRSVPDPSQRFTVQVAADVAAEEPQHCGGVFQGGSRVALRIRRSRVELVAPESGAADGHWDPEAEERASDGTRESHQPVVSAGQFRNN